MSEADPSGYGDSPDTSDGAAADPGTADDSAATLTTDDDAQREDSVQRPGNSPD